jgi:putative ABC transport system permease protein
MLSYRFVLRHFTRHWRINLIVLVSLLLATTFLSALPMYTTAIAERTLRANLESATGPARHIQFSRPGHPMTAALWGDIREVMGSLLSERVDVFETGENAIRSASFIFRPDGTAIVVDEEAYFRVWSFDELETTVNVVEGRFPRYLEPDPFNLAFQEQEVAIGREAAAAMGITVGDELRTAGGDLHLLVVGLLEPQDPAAERWFGDPAPFGIERVERGNQPDLVNLSLLVPMLTMRNTFAGSNEYWRALTDVSTLNMANVAQVRGDLMEIQSRWEGLVLDSSLLAMIDAHLRDLETAEVSVFLLAGQSFLFVLYTITIASSFVLDRTRSELATMADRGVNGGQLTGIFAVEAGLLAFVIALPAGPLLARLLLQVWSGETLPAQVPMGSWGLALAAALFGWLALVLSVAWAMRHGSTLSWQQAQARPGQRTNWQRAYVDVFLLALAGLIYWQLNETGTFINIGRGETDAGLADPLLLLGPTLFLLAIALLFLRFFPLLLRLAAWLSKRVRSLILPFGLSRLARDPAGPSRVVLLVSVAAALTFFAVTYEHSLRVRQVQMAHYVTGADMRIRLPHDAPATDVQQISSLSPVEAAAPAYRNPRARYADSLGRQATLLAVDPETFADVSTYPPALTSLTIPGLMDALVVSQMADNEAIPAIFSTTAHPQNKQVGDQIRYFVGSEPVRFEVRGIVVNFPALEGEFIITNLAALESRVDIPNLLAPFNGYREVWLAVTPAGDDLVIDQIQTITGAQVEATAADRLQLLQAFLPAAETLGAFNLNALTLMALSVAVFLMVHFFSAQQRRHEFGVMRSMGLSGRQLLGLLSLEGVIMVGLGLLAGVIIGLGLAAVMRPFFSDALAEAIAGGNLYALLVDWPRLLGLYGLLILVYTAAMAISSLVLMRAGIYRTVRIGEE